MSRRHILADLHDFKLDPTKAHKLNKERLYHETKAVVVNTAAVIVLEAQAETIEQEVIQSQVHTETVDAVMEVFELPDESPVIEIPAVEILLEEALITEEILLPEKKISRKMKKRELE